MNNRRDYVDVLLRRWPIVAAMPILAVLTAAIVGLAAKPVYEASAVIALAPSTLSVPAANQAPPYYLMVDASSRLPTAFTPAYYVALLNSADVVNAVAPATAVTVASDGSDKSLLRITAQGQDPKLVAQTANKWAEVGASRIAQALSPAEDELNSAQKQLEAAEQALVKFAQDNKLDYDPNKLRTVGGLGTDKRLELDRLLRERDSAETVYLDFASEYERSSIRMAGAFKPAIMPAPIPTSPTSPKLAQGILAGAGLGLLAGILGAFAVELTSRK